LQAAGEAGIPIEIVPGVTAASAAAAAFGVSLTERGTSDTLVLSSGMSRSGDPLPDTTRLSGPGTTNAFYMSVGQASRIKAALLERGMPPSSKVRIAAKVSHREQALSECRLDTLDAHLERTGCEGCAVILVTWSKAGDSSRERPPLQTCVA
jgi:uroporphyrin-III C-methyltransferase/precorrin-2 dehydrogenase/sirohydrochlorin ferrochelatase